MPVWHASVCVHAFPSLQPVPSGAAGFEHTPVPVLQTPATWHGSLAVQVTGLAPVHAPDWQESVCVHAFPSEQPDPSATIVSVPLIVLAAPWLSVTFRVIVCGPTPRPSEASCAAETVGVAPVASITASPFKSHSYVAIESPHGISGSDELIPFSRAGPPAQTAYGPPGPANGVRLPITLIKLL